MRLAKQLQRRNAARPATWSPQLTVCVLIALRLLRGLGESSTDQLVDTRAAAFRALDLLVFVMFRESLLLGEGCLTLLAFEFVVGHGHLLCQRIECQPESQATSRRRLAIRSRALPPVPHTQPTNVRPATPLYPLGARSTFRCLRKRHGLFPCVSHETSSVRVTLRRVPAPDQRSDSGFGGAKSESVRSADSGRDCMPSGVPNMGRVIQCTVTPAMSLARVGRRA